MGLSLKSIEKENKTLTFLLGYLSPSDWASALKNDKLNEVIIQELIGQQELAGFSGLGEAVRREMS